MQYAIIKLNIAGITVTVNIAADPHSDSPRVNALITDLPKGDVTINEPARNGERPVGYWLQGAN
jgi:hypothetical protein